MHNHGLPLPVLLFALLVLAGSVAAEDAPLLHVGSEQDFRPYAFVNKDGQAAGFGPDLIKAVANAMGLKVRHTTGSWDEMWNGLVSRQLDVLPVVAKTPGRVPLVDFSLPHTETFDAFFVREGRPAIKDLAAAAGKEIVVLRSDAAHHELIELHFSGQVIPVESIPDGLRLVASGKHDAMLCSKLVGVLEIREAGIKGIEPGPPIREYKRVFSFGVKKGNPDLVEKLNQGLLIVKTSGEYDRIYRKWLSAEMPGPLWKQYGWPAVALVVALAALVLAWRVSRPGAAWDDRLLKALTPVRLWALSPAWRYAIAAAIIVVVATLMRMALPPRLGTVIPFNIALIAVMLVTVMLGLGPGLLTVVLGDIAVEMFVLRAPMSEPATLLRLGLSIALGVFVVSMLHAARVAAVKARDNAERARRGEAVLQYQAELIERMSDGVIECDGDFRVRMWNAAAERIYGWKAAEAMGRNVEELFQTEFPGTTAQEARARLMHQGALTLDVIHSHKDGRRLHIQSTVSITRDDTGRVSSVVGIQRDLTKQRQAEIAVARERDLLQSVLNSAGKAHLVYLDRDFNFVRVNETYAATCGCRPEELIGKNHFALYPHAENEAIFRRVRDTGEPFEIHDKPFEFPDRPERGVTYWDWTLIPVKDAGGQLIGLIWSLFETTARKRAEAALAAAHQQIQGLIDNTPAIVYAFDRDGRFILANAAVAKVLDTTPQMLLGKRRHEFMPKEDADGHEANDRLVFESGHALDFEEHSKLPGRSITWLTTKFPLRDAEGRIYAVAGISSDISVRKQAEEALRESERRLRLATAAGGLVPWEIDLVAGEVMPSPGLFAAFGLNPGEAIRSRPQWRNLIHEEDRQKIFESVEAAKAGQSTHHVEYRFRHPDGTIHWHESHGLTVADERGHGTRLVGFFRDITDRKKAEADLRAAKEAMEAANTSKDKFIAALSHELRTPLTPALAAAGIMKEDRRLPEDLREDAAMIHRNLGLEVHLVADLLDVTRIATGRLHLEKRPTDVALVIREAVRICSADLDAKLQVLTVAAPESGCIAEADEPRLHQVFWNLIRNAIKFTPRGGRIEVKARIEEPVLVVDIHDNGVGISPQMLGTIFEPFEQDRSADAHRFGGLGLGLSICKAIVEAHGGRIVAHSEGIGRGATFTVELPLMAGSELRVQGSEDPSSLNPEPRTLNPLRILLVEDHVDTARLMARLLKVEGHKVVPAHSVESALRSADGQHFDLLISDLGLPDGTGNELMKQLIGRGQAIKAIALSGYGSQADMDRSREAGFAEHLTKPVDFAALHAAVVRVTQASPVEAEV